MHEILILSGKGGTGKTSITAAFAHLASGHVICDLDVDAPDLHLLLAPEHDREERFVSGHEAAILADRCEDCGVCMEHCRFGAISPGDGHPVVNPMKCEGCKVCVALCPADAVSFAEKECGIWYVSRTRFGPMVHAQLHPGEENSGRLVALLRQQAKSLAEKRDRNLILSDGPPGIGCPVISSLAGVAYTVIVTEPTPSGRHDLARVMELCEHFKVPAGVVINKADLNETEAGRIAALCGKGGPTLLGRLPHDPVMTHAMIAGQTVTEYENGPFTEKITEIWNAVLTNIDMRSAA